MIEEALRRAGAAEDIDEMLAEFLVHYEANIAAESRPFLGAVASLETLAASGARLAICTNKREYLTRKLLEALGLQHRVLPGATPSPCRSQTPGTSRAGAASPRPPTPQICPISTGLLSTWSHSQRPLSPAFRSFRLHAFPRERKRC